MASLLGVILGWFPSLSLPLLRWLVERRDEAVRDVIRGVERSVEAWENVREATEKRVQQILTAPQRQFDEIQHRIDAQVRKSVARVKKNPTIRAEVRRIEKSIQELENRLRHITRDSSKPKRPASKRKRKR